MSVFGCVHMSAGAYRCQRRASGPFELELKAVVSCHVGTGNQLWILSRGSILNCLAISTASWACSCLGSDWRSISSRLLEVLDQDHTQYMTES